MSIDSNESTNNAGQNDESKLRDFKVVCAKLGFSMCVFFICRLAAGWVSLLLGSVAGGMSDAVFSILHSVILILFVYVIPVLFSAGIFRSFSSYKGKYRILYKKPKRLARALGTFPATFGFGHGIALLTLLVSFLVTRYLGGETYIADLLRPTVIEPSTDITGVLAMFFMLVVAAPVFEEFLTRGVMFDALKPYGNGFAILISALLFALMHGSLYMLFYTFAYGLALGYIRYATGSLFTVTILHAIVNSIGAGTLLLMSLVEITNEESRLINTINFIYIVAVLILIVVGIIVFISKIPAIRKYKIENTWTDIGAWKKTAWFFVSVPVIIMMVLAINDITGNLLLGLLVR